MAEGKVKSREAKMDCDEHVLEGEKTKTPITKQEMNYLTMFSLLISIKYCRRVNYVVLR